MNSKRFEILRAIAISTKRFLESLSITGWVLDGGTAIGAMRCDDVLPWDVDCDVLVPEDGIEKIFRKFFDSPYSRTYKYQNLSADIQIDKQPFQLRTKSTCIPVSLIDKRNGYYCDIIVVRRMKGEDDGADVLQTSWPGGLSTVSDFGCGDKGYEWATDVIYPTKPCRLGSETFPCANDLTAYFQEEYAGGVSEPDVDFEGMDEQLLDEVEGDEQGYTADSIAETPEDGPT